jgi:hypothetical protein
MPRDLIAVISGGFIGGVFWLLTQIIGANTIALSTAVYAYAIIGGIIAAGIAAYLPSDVDHSKVKKLFFVSAVAGLSFPSIISTATNAKDIAQIHGTNKQVQQSVEAVQQQISSPTVNPAQVAQDIKQAGSTLNTSPASADVKLNYDSVSKTAINSLSAKAQQSKDPSDYVKAIEQIGTVPQFHSDVTTKLVQLSNSSNPQVSAAAKPALMRLNYTAFQFNEAAPAATAATASDHHR